MRGLLPENYTKAFKREKIFQLCFWVIFYIALVFMFGIALLLPSFFALTFSLDDILRKVNTEEISLGRKSAENLENKISSLNLVLRDYNQNEIKKFSFSNILHRFINVSSNGIKINNIDFDKNQENIFFFRLSGEATSRNDIISYVRELKNLKEISIVRSPISNLLKDTKLPFTIEADIKKEFYEQKYKNTDYKN